MEEDEKPAYEVEDYAHILSNLDRSRRLEQVSRFDHLWRDGGAERNPGRMEADAPPAAIRRLLFDFGPSVFTRRHAPPYHVERKTLDALPLFGVSSRNLWDHRLRKRRRGYDFRERCAGYQLWAVSCCRNARRTRFREQVIEDVHAPEGRVQLQVHARNPRSEGEERVLLERGHVVPEGRECLLGLPRVAHDGVDVRRIRLRDAVQDPIANVRRIRDLVRPIRVGRQVLDVIPVGVRVGAPIWFRGVYRAIRRQEHWQRIVRRERIVGEPAEEVDAHGVEVGYRVGDHFLERNGFDEDVDSRGRRQLLNVLRPRRGGGSVDRVRGLDVDRNREAGTGQVGDATVVADPRGRVEVVPGLHHVEDVQSGQVLVTHHARRDDSVERGPEGGAKFLVPHDLVQILLVVKCVREGLPHVQVHEEVRRHLIPVRVRARSHRGLVDLQVEVPPEHVQGGVELNLDEPQSL